MDKPIGARISSDLLKEINAYLEVNKELSMGGLIRLALLEYLWSHPLEEENPYGAPKKLDRNRETEMTLADPKSFIKPMKGAR